MDKKYKISKKEKQSLCAKRRNKLIKKATGAELIFKDKLDQMKIRYMFQKGFIAGNNFCIVDFYLPKPYKLCIEIDGGYHSTEEQQIRDTNRTNYLERQRGFKVIRFTNEEAETFSDVEIKQRLGFLPIS